MPDQLSISMVADVSEFIRAMKDVEKQLEEVQKKAQEAQKAVNDAKKAINKSTGGSGSGGKKKTVGEDASKAAKEPEKQTSFIEDMFPAIGKLKSTWKKASGEIDKRMGANTIGAKAMKAGVVGALAAIALEAGKAAWEFGKQTASMFDPISYQKAAGSAKHSIRELKTTIGSLTSPIVNGIMKAIDWIASGLNTILGWIRQGIALLQGFLTNILQPVIDGVKAVVDYLKEGINAIANFFGFDDVFKKSSEGSKKTAENMEEIVDETSAGLASFDKLNTLNLDNAGDAEEAAELQKKIDAAKEAGSGLADKLKGWPGNLGEVWNDFKKKAKEAWDDIREYFGGLWERFCETLRDAWESFVEWATNAWDSICAYFGELWETVKAAILNAWASFQEAATAAWDWVVTKATEVWNSILALATSIWNAIKGVATTIWNAISSLATSVWNRIRSVATTVWEVISTPILTLWNTFRKIGTSAWNALRALGNAFNRRVVDPIKSAVQWCMKKIEWVLNKIESAKSFLGNAASAVSNAVGGAVDKVKGAIGLAGGGVVAPNNPQLYVLGDNKVEPEVVSPVSLMKSAVKAAIEESGGAGGGQFGPIVLEVRLDSKVIARQTWESLKNESIRRGATL